MRAKMAMQSYSELLLDPRWQRKRLEILGRDNFSCTSCGANDKTLHVHHKKYKKGSRPWEYESSELHTLCKDCHANNHALKDALAFLVAEMDDAVLMQLLGYAEALIYGYDPIKIRDGEHAIGVGARYGIGYIGVIELMRDGYLYAEDVIGRAGN